MSRLLALDGKPGTVPRWKPSIKSEKEASSTTQQEDGQHTDVSSHECHSVSFKTR